MELNSISFKHTVKDFILGDLSLGNFPISVSYDRTGNTLIGMDILKKLDIFIGKNKKEEIVLIACPGNQESQSFVAVLSELIDVKKSVKNETK